ncbi:multiple epidermal growth factor-like domains protein 11 isoform X4 [Saccostrea cucullata]|uniref:multiple epidermal growth factor-like domains protein 11 isoform X4 n=1 Tax=Saccostrea cuccullata TaxID=36930 RepID=UPI002ED5211F
MHMITVKEALKMRILFNCLLIQFVCMDISLGYDDISAYKPTKQGHDRQILDVAANVVDRSFSTCSTTGASNPSWWYVDLQKVKSIYDVEIYFRLYDTYLEQRQRERMYGYKLYISNSTAFSLLHEAYLCYNHTGPDLPDLNVTHICVSFGRYVIFYNERVHGVHYPGDKITYTQLCEVIVQGCELDYVYGSFCNETCPSNCQERRCYVTNGTCVGCTDGWIGEQCLDACVAGFYGAECKRKCSDRCRNSYCDHVTGYCEGCRIGWMGRDCNKSCNYGTYGENCEKNCSVNCAKKENCDRESGACDDGCVPGFKRSKCEEECDFGSYSVNCLKLCSGNCFENTTCNKVNGECMDGCREGFQGIMCNETCDLGTFGLNCSKICSSHCVNNSCHHVTGSCDSGCMPGWKTDKCFEKCSNGTYGIMCKEKCSGNCLNIKTCHYVSGYCNHGCQAGYKGEKCDAPCDSGTFGENCSRMCSLNCYDICDKVNGLCKCKKGWVGINCSEVCPPGTYGEDCGEECSGNCVNNDTCYHINGHCLWGCIEGFRGKRCDQQYKLVGFQGSYMEEGDKADGLTAGLVISLMLNVGLLFLIVLRIFRKKKTVEKNDQPSYEISDREGTQRRSTSDCHVENHVYEELNPSTFIETSR